MIFKQNEQPTQAIRIFQVGKYVICKSTTDAITLSLPVYEKGWYVTSNVQPAEIQKLDIDTYEPGEICPQMKLYMEWKGSGEPKEERVSIPMTGGNITSFTLLCKPKPQPQVANSSSRRQDDLGQTANTDTAPIRQQVPSVAYKHLIQCKGEIIFIGMQ